MSKKRLLVLAASFSIAAFSHNASATLYVGNLGNLWTDGGIGDIHALFPGGNPYGSDTVSFTTGPGTFSLNTITLEFEFSSSYPAGLSAPGLVSVQLFQQTGSGSVFL